jgi:hypothetical protein
VSVLDPAVFVYGLCMTGGLTGSGTAIQATSRSWRVVLEITVADLYSVTSVVLLQDVASEEGTQKRPWQCFQAVSSNDFKHKARLS